MVFPAPVFAVKALGILQGVYFTHQSRKPLSMIKCSDVRRSWVQLHNENVGCAGGLLWVLQCYAGPATWLLAYRLLAFLYALAIGSAQLAKVGRRLFVYFTVWNWWFMTAYFGLGAVASARAIQARRRGGEVKGGLLEKILVVMFHVEAPLVWVIDATTWLVLVPMLLAVPDPEKRAHWERIMFSFTSYNQHGFNAVMMLLELALSRIPVSFYMSGYMALWLSAFAVWSTLFYIHTGRFIYPFLDAHKPYAWAVYLALYSSFWAAYLAFMGMHRVKSRLLEGRPLAPERKFH